MLTNKRRSLLAKLREEEPGFKEVGKSVFPGHATFSSKPNNKSGRSLNPFSKNDMELKEYRASLPASKTFKNWRLQTRPSNINESPLPNLTHLNLKNQRNVISVLNGITRRNKTLKSPKMAKYLANIESKHNNPIDMKKAVRNLKLSADEEDDLIQNIDGLFPVENYYGKSRGLGQRRLVKNGTNKSQPASAANRARFEKELAEINY